MALQSSELEQFPALTWDEIAPQASAEIHTALERVLETQDGACLRGDERYKSTPILVLTTESDPDIKVRAKRAGATGWIVKPFDPRKLAEAIRKVTA